MLASESGHAVKETSARVLELMPFMGEFDTPGWSEKCVEIWSRFFEASSWDDLASVPALLEVPEIGLVSHVRATWACSEALAGVVKEECGVDPDLESLRAIAALHDASKLVEYGVVDGVYRLTRLGETYPHAVLAGTAAGEAGFPEVVVNTILEHPYHPPHIHVRPKSIERLIFHYADQAAVDTVLFARGLGTHLEFRRFFSL